MSVRCSLVGALSRKKLLDRLICSDSAILLSTGRGIGFGKEGITGKFGELETDLQFSKNQVCHDRFGFGQSLTMALDSFPKPVSGSVTHESIKTRPSPLSWFNSAHKMITPMVAPAGADSL